MYFDITYEQIILSFSLVFRLLKPTFFTAAPNSGGIARRSPAPSPTMRRRNLQEQNDQSRGLRRQADASPQRHDDVTDTRKQERSINYKDQYKVRQRQQQQNKENYRVSSDSSSDSDFNRVGSGWVMIFMIVMTMVNYSDWLWWWLQWLMMIRLLFMIRIDYDWWWWWWLMTVIFFQ